METEPFNDASFRIIEDVLFGKNVVVYPFTNLYGCRIGDNTRIGPFVEIQDGALIGANCKVQSHVFICTGVEIEDEVFIGHGVIFVNDKYPRATTPAGVLQGRSDWAVAHTMVERGATIGSGAVVLGGVRIAERALVGAGAVVTRDVGPGQTVVGNPARPLPAAGSSCPTDAAGRADEHHPPPAESSFCHPEPRGTAAVRVSLERRGSGSPPG
jgi:acetyltransferase-like isoleucine patch superfamily enzyme